MRQSAISGLSACLSNQQGRILVIHRALAEELLRAALTISPSSVSRLKNCISMQRALYLQIHRAFAEELLCVFSTPQVASYEGVETKQKNAVRPRVGQTVRRAKRLSAKDIKRTSWVCKTTCSACENKMYVLDTRCYRRRLECKGCGRRVTVISDKQPELA